MLSARDHDGDPMTSSSSQRTASVHDASPSSLSLLGSYKTSLFWGRMPAPTSSPTPFIVIISIVGIPPCPTHLLSPPKLHLNFNASYYDLHGPWIGTVNLLQSASIPPSDIDEHAMQVAPKGQLQLVIRNQLGTVVRLLVVPYDMRHLPPGSCTFLRRVWYVGQPAAIRYAVHMQFISPEIEPKKQHTHSHSREPSLESPFEMNAESTPPRSAKGVRNFRKVYLQRDLKLVFASRSPDPEEVVRVVHEDADGYFPWVIRSSPTKHGTYQVGALASQNKHKRSTSSSLSTLHTAHSTLDVHTPEDPTVNLEMNPENSRSPSE